MATHKRAGNGDRIAATDVSDIMGEGSGANIRPVIPWLGRISARRTGGGQVTSMASALPDRDSGATNGGWRPLWAPCGYATSSGTVGGADRMGRRCSAAALRGGDGGRWRGGDGGRREE
jgi:hypothetical protein